MNIPKLPPLYLIGGGAVVLMLGYVYFRGVRGAAADVGGAIVNGGVGLVEGAGGAILDTIGTDQVQCEIACAAGDTWGVVKNCTQYRYASYLWNGK